MFLAVYFPGGLKMKKSREKIVLWCHNLFESRSMKNKYAKEKQLVSKLIRSWNQSTRKLL